MMKKGRKKNKKKKMDGWIFNECCRIGSKFNPSNPCVCVSLCDGLRPLIGKRKGSSKKKRRKKKRER